MQPPIKTNKIVFKLDKEIFSEKYDLFAVKTSKKHFKSGAYILDSRGISDKILSIYYYSGKCIYVLMKKSNDSKMNLKKAISETDDAENTTVSKIECHLLEEYITLQLLFNAIGSYESELLRASNLTGRLFCYNPSWIIHGITGDNKNTKQIVCLELRITSDYVLRFDVRTFTSVKYKSKITFSKKKFEEYPQYVIGKTGKYTISRKLPSDNECNSFILRQIDGKKSNRPFFDIYNYDKSKLSIISNAVIAFNQKYKDFATIDFEAIQEYESFNYLSETAKEEKLRLKSQVSKYKIKIIDGIEDNYSIAFCGSLKRILEERYGLEISVGKRLSKKHLNIRLIHNAEFYEGDWDPYKQHIPGYTIQHITLEDFAGKAEQLAESIVTELIIKNDLKQSKMSAFDWKKLNLTEKVSFGVSLCIDECERYFFMDVFPDGRFDIKEQTNNLFEASEYNECIDLFAEANAEDKTVEGIIKQKDSVGFIYDTGYITLPELFKINSELAAGNTKLRSKDIKEELFSSVLDIKTMSKNDKQYYFVGTIGSNLKWSINNSSHIRCVEAYKGKIDADIIAPLMITTIVHNGQLTVVPFPFKYLREYLKTLNID